MYAEIPGSLAAEKNPFIEVNQIYEIQHFKILTAKSFHRPVDASLMMQFTVFTQIHVVPDPPNTFPSLIYKFRTN
jgi:hypothetical protein